MKRKLFTLLFAFMALAAFQTNAQVSYYWIDADTTTNPGATGVAASPGTSQYIADQIWSPKTSQLSFDAGKNFNVTGALNHKFGEYSRYFSVNYTGSTKVEFYIGNHDGSAQLNLNTSGVGQTNKWQVVKFDQATGVPTAQALDKMTGMLDGSPSTYVEGYLVYPISTETAQEDNFKLVLVNRSTGAVTLQNYKWWSTVANQKDWNPVWVRLMPIGGRWATPNDFAGMDFVQFRDKAGSLLTVNDNKKVTAGFSTFRVNYIAGNSPKEGDAVNTDPLQNGRGNAGMWLNTTTGIYEVPVFNLISPEDSCKLVSVAKNNVKFVVGQASNGAYADKLEMRYPYAGAYLPEEQGAQEFGIWIDLDGNMNVYPRVGYVADYSKAASAADRWLNPLNHDGTPATAVDTDWSAANLLAGYLNYGYYQFNASIYRNNWNMPTSDSYANQAFKIGTYTQGNITPVLAPVSGYSSTQMTEYAERIFQPKDASAYEIKSGRFFFLETQPITIAGAGKGVNNTTSYVLSVFGAKDIGSGDNTKIHSNYNDWATTNVKLTPKEAIRRGGTENGVKAYINDPFDSIRMASHWEVIEVRDASSQLAGYTFKNELGYYLQFDAAGTLLAETPTTAAAGDLVYTSAVWKAVKMAGDSNEYFSLRNNLGGATSLYLDTVVGAWSKADMERPSSVQGQAILNYYYNKDVILTTATGCGGGIQFKLTSDEDNWPPAKGTAQEHGQTGVIDHTNDLQYPKQDSLCTYMHRQGVYNISEAFGLEVSLTMGDGGIVYVTDTKEFGNVSVEPVGDERKPEWKWVTPGVSGYWDTKGFLGTDVMFEANYLKSLGTTAELGGLAASTIDPVANPSGAINLGTAAAPIAYDSLLMDTYKWHYVKYNNMYLVYDTVNYTTKVPEDMFGFKFKNVDKRNATPVRFYQPLVGDKKYENFIIEFKVNDFYYEVDAQGNIIPAATSTQVNGGNKTHQYKWYGSTKTATYATADLQYAAAQPEWVAGATRFARIGKQTDPLNTRNSADNATRWRFTGVEVLTCQQNFITSNYLLSEGMYMMPLTAEQYLRGNAFDPSRYMTNAATVKQTLATAGKVTHTLADTLYKNPVAGGLGWIGDATRKGTGTDYTDYYPSNRNYKNSINVELFYVTNEQGYYLTVSDTTEMGQTEAGTTSHDVSGAMLKFVKDKYTYNGTGLDRRPLQMFAIYGCMNTDGDVVENGKLKGYGEFIYLPATSWMMDYTIGRSDGTLKNNENLGTANTSGYPIVNTSFRIGLYGYENNLVVMPASGTTSTNIVAAEFKFTREGYYKGPFCEHTFVQNTNSKAYYNGKGTATCADLTKPDMHWEIEHVKVNGAVVDSTLFQMRTELKVRDGQAYVPTQFTGHYYFVKQAVANQYLAIPLNSPKDTVRLTITDIDCPVIQCTDNYKKFSIGELAGTDWGIIESYYTDRCVWTNDTTFRLNTQKLMRADAIGKKLLTTEKADFLDIEPSYVRVIAEHHNVPYYNIIRVDSAGVKYFMEMRGDSTIFRTVTDLELDTLTRYNEFPVALPGMKFCFPYRLEANTCPAKIATKEYKGTLYDQVFVQSLDTANVSAYLLKFQAASGKLACTAIDPDTIEYTETLGNLPGQLDATTWIFGDNYGSDYEWVKLSGVTSEMGKKNYDRDAQSTTGLLSAAANGAGSRFVIESGASGATVNYGILDIYDATKDAKLTFEFEGDTLIGSYAARPIWYYRIKDATGQYLANAQDSAKTAKYEWSDDKPYAYFGGLMPNKVGNPITADASYDQTFGLRHVPISMQPNKKEEYLFWVVSGVDYQNPGNTEYYYLSEINQRLVFSKADLTKPNDVLNTAMMFQLGNVKDGTYTDITPVEAGVVKVYGLIGAVKVVNATGLVEIYTIDGRLFKSETVSGTEQTIAAPRGVVIVKNGANVAKVVVK